MQCHDYVKRLNRNMVSVVIVTEFIIWRYENKIFAYQCHAHCLPVKIQCGAITCLTVQMASFEIDTVASYTKEKKRKSNASGYKAELLVLYRPCIPRAILYTLSVRWESCWRCSPFQ